MTLAKLGETTAGIKIMTVLEEFSRMCYFAVQVEPVTHKGNESGHFRPFKR